MISHLQKGEYMSIMQNKFIVTNTVISVEIPGLARNADGMKLRTKHFRIRMSVS